MFPEFEKPILVYVPCYNCESSVAKTISEIPAVLHSQIECLIIDNSSLDRTCEVVKAEASNNRHPFKITLIKMHENVGYSGSQKTAYFLACKSPKIKHVIMLHGDGQYPAEQLAKFIPYFEREEAIINGYRDKRVSPHKEETPFITYAIIKFLSLLENFVTGAKQREWHSGFVMYRKDFLKKVPLQYLSNTPHIDGEFLMSACVLKEKTASIPIYKKYKEFETFGGLARMKYVVNVFQAMLRFKQKYYHKILSGDSATYVDYKFDVIA